MIKRSLLVILLCAAVAGCQSPTELRAGPAALQVTVNTPPEKLAGCIGDKLEAWASNHQGTLSSRPTGDGYSLAVNTMVYSGTDTVILVDISGQNGKSQVRMFTHFLMGGQTIPGIIQDCLS